MTGTDPALASPRAQLAGEIAPQWHDVAIVRTARVPHRCVSADEIRGYTITVNYAEPQPGGVISSSVGASSPEEAERQATDRRARYPGAEVTVEPRRNPGYRSGCLGAIAPGDVYVDYIGEAAFAENGRPYCACCAVAVWGQESA